MLFVENGGHLSFSDSWARNICNEMERNGKKMKRRIVTTCKIPVAPALLEEEKFKFQRNLITLVKKHKIPEELILNYDQTPLSYVCTSNTTLEVRGSNSVPIVGKEKQKQITGTFTVSADGDFLRMQFMKENRSLSSKWNKLSRRIQYNPYSKSLELEKSAIEHLEKVVFPYLSKEREQLKMPKDKKALLIFDVFKGQTTQQVKDIILENNCVYVFCAEKPHKSLSTILDLNANGQAKQFLKCKFESWHADQVTKEIEKGRNVLFVNIETKLSVPKAQMIPTECFLSVRS